MYPNPYKQIFVILLLACKIFGQSEFQNWHFGSNAGLNFGTNPPSIITNTLNTLEGCASISDTSGNVLFYTNGIDVVTSTHTIMANGSGLSGNNSSTQSAIIVKQPGNSNLYYIFTCTGMLSHNYSIVDMSLASGAGSVTVKNATLFTPSTERQVAIKHCNGKDVWIVAHEYNSSNFHAYLLSGSGVNITPVLSAIGPTLAGGFGAAIGSLKCSEDGRKLAMTTTSNTALASGYHLFDFDPATGQVTNSVTLLSPMNGAYGIEFSPDGSKLYGCLTPPATATSQALMYQWDICSNNPTVITSSIYTYTFGPAANISLGAIQKAPNNKLYITYNSASNLHVINSPNSSGSAMNLVLNAQNLGSNVGRYGLPNFVNKGRNVPSTFIKNVVCESATVSIPSFSPVALCSSTANPYSSVMWNFGDNASAQNTATTNTATHVFSSLGMYTVNLVLYGSCTNDTISQVINIASLTPTVNVAGTFTVCKGDKRIYVASGGNSYQWSGSANTTASITLSPTVTTVYTVNAVQGTCSNAQSFTITVNKCSGISEQEDSFQLALYPNPTKEQLTLQIQNNAFLKVFALDGTIYLRQSLQKGSNDIEVSQLEPGVFIFEISDGIKIYRKRVVILNE